MAQAPKNYTKMPPKPRSLKPAKKTNKKRNKNIEEMKTLTDEERIIKDLNKKTNDIKALGDKSSEVTEGSEEGERVRVPSMRLPSDSSFNETEQAVYMTDVIDEDEKDYMRNEPKMKSMKLKKLLMSYRM